MTRNSRRRNTKNLQLHTGAPTRNTRGGFAVSQHDINELQGLTNPFSAHARGSKLPDSDSSRSVAITLVERRGVGTLASGKFAVRVTGTLKDSVGFATAISGQTATTFGAMEEVSDMAAFEAQFQNYRIVSWGVKAFTSLAPLDQKGIFTMFTIPPAGVSTGAIDGFNAGSSLYEEVRNFPITDTTVQWISKPVGIEHREYKSVFDTQEWDDLVIFGQGLPVSQTVMFLEIYYNLECTVKFGEMSGAAATAAADFKPHMLAGMGHVAKHLAGTKTGQEIKSSIGHWIKQGLLTAGKTGLAVLANKYGVPPQTSYALLGN